METHVQEKLRRFAEARGFVPSNDGSHDNLSGELPPSGSAVNKADRVLRRQPTDISILAGTILDIREQMLSEAGWDAEGSEVYRGWLERTRDTGLAVDEIANGSELGTVRMFKHQSEKTSTELACALFFDSLTDPRISDHNSPLHRYRRIHKFTLELAARVGFWDLGDNIYQKFPQLCDSSTEFKMTPRVSHHTLDFDLSFILLGKDVATVDHPFFVRGISIVRDRI